MYAFICYKCCIPCRLYVQCTVNIRSKSHRLQRFDDLHLPPKSTSARAGCFSSKSPTKLFGFAQEIWWNASVAHVAECKSSDQVSQNISELFWYFLGTPWHFEPFETKSSKLQTRHGAAMVVISWQLRCSQQRCPRSGGTCWTIAGHQRRGGVPLESVSSAVCSTMWPGRFFVSTMSSGVSPPVAAGPHVSRHSLCGSSCWSTALASAGATQTLARGSCLRLLVSAKKAWWFFRMYFLQRQWKQVK